MAAVVPAALWCPRTLGPRWHRASPIVEPPESPSPDRPSAAPALAVGIPAILILAALPFLQVGDGTSIPEGLPLPRTVPPDAPAPAGRVAAPGAPAGARSASRGCGASLPASPASSSIPCSGWRRSAALRPPSRDGSWPTRGATTRSPGPAPLERRRHRDRRLRLCVAAVLCEGAAGPGRPAGAWPPPCVVATVRNDDLRRPRRGKPDPRRGFPHGACAGADPSPGGSSHPPRPLPRGAHAHR